MTNKGKTFLDCTRKVTRFLLKKKGRRGRKKVIEKDCRIFIIFGEGGYDNG
jgi:hypothetical protein